MLATSWRLFYPVVHLLEQGLLLLERLAHLALRSPPLEGHGAWATVPR